MPEDPRPDGNEEESNEDESATPDEKRESDDASEDLDSLFEDDSQEDETPEDKVKRLEDKITRIEKGVKKLATDKGREQKEKPTEERVEEKVETGVNPVLKSLYFKANPEAQDIWDEVEKDAKELGKDPFVLYEGSAYYKGEAKTRAEAKAKEEESRKKVNIPSSDTDFSKDVSSIKEDEVHRLTPAQKVKWLEAQVKKEKASIE